MLRQITLPRAAIVAAVSGFRAAAQAAGATSWHLARLRLPGGYEEMLDQVEVTVAGQPLPRLQADGSAQAVFPFLYELSWGPRESFSPVRLRRHRPRGPAIELLPGAGDELLRLGPVIRPLIEVHWTRMVADLNGVASEELDLHRHLFGSDRLLPRRPLRDGIAALQEGRCFYCHGPLGTTPEADHFITRVRCGIDAVENLVLADRRCNNDKRDLLPGPVHVTAWTHRNQHHDAALTALAAGLPGGTPTRPGPSRWPARSTATCRRAAPRYGSGTKMSPWPTLPQPQRPCANDGQTAKRRRGPHTGGSQVGSHPRPTPGHTEPIGSFDSFSLPGIQTQPDTSSVTMNLVRIEGVRGSNPLSSTEFLQVRDLFPVPRPQLPRSVSDFGSDLGADFVVGAVLLGEQGVEDRHD